MLMHAENTSGLHERKEGSEHCDPNPVCVCVCVGCVSSDTGMMLSSWSTSTIEEVAEAAPGGVRWMQLYIYKDRTLTQSLVRRAEDAGYKGIFVTVDTPYLGRRRDDVRNRFKLPSHLR